MASSVRRSAAYIGLWVLAALVLTGCSAGYNIHVATDSGLRKEGAAVEVHLIAPNEAEYAALANKSMTAYWEPRDPDRAALVNAGMVKVFRFDAKSPQEQTLGKDDPIWKTWGNSKRLLVLSSLPRNAPDLPEGQDPRRRTLPLEADRWEGRDIKVEVHLGGLRVVTSQRH